MATLEGVALVTGAAQRIGAAIVRELHAAGMKLAVHYHRSGTEAEALVASLNAARPDSAMAIAADLRRVDALEALAQQAAGRWGRLDALVNNASSYYQTPLGTLTEAQFDELIGANLKAPLFLAQACAARLSDGGSIVNILDIHAHKTHPRFSAYLAGKAGLWAVTETLAQELAPRLRVNAVAPGHMIWTTTGVLSPQEEASELAKIPLGRLGGGGEVAHAVRFLLSSEAAYLNGAVIPVDGGLRLA